MSIPLTAHRSCHSPTVYQDRTSVFDCDLLRRSSSHGKLAGMQGVVSRPDVRKQHPTESLALLSDSGWTMLDLYTTSTTPCLPYSAGLSEQDLRV